jgi:hypothetical protein
MPSQEARRRYRSVLIFCWLALLALGVDACTLPLGGATGTTGTTTGGGRTTDSVPTAGEPAWGFPLRPGVTGNIGLPENHPDSRLHHANYDVITDDTTNQKFNLEHGNGNGWEYASLDVGAFGGAISSSDVTDENALALAPGFVRAVQRSCNAVLIDHLNGWSVLYLHLDADRIWVPSGDSVQAGTPIGVPTTRVSGCGQDSGYQHVHFALLYQGKYVSMKGRKLCGRQVLDNGLAGVQTVSPSPSQPSAVPIGSNFIFTVPATCPSEKPMANVNVTDSSVGYRVLRGNVTGLRAQWTMPTISGPGAAGMNVSINLGCWQGNVNRASNACIGVFTYGSVQSHGSVRYATNYGTGATFTPFDLPISPGAVFAASIEQAAGSKENWTLTLANVTRGQRAQQMVTVDLAGQLSETYPTCDIGPVTQHTPANFTQVRYTNAQVRIGAERWRDLSALPYQRTEWRDGSVSVAQASGLTGGAFTIDRLH